jgi:heme ABC exporter ATP-binding subunit CcmA
VCCFKLEVQHAGKYFGAKCVFADVSFTHQAGALGIAGSNGSGKSTLLQCISGLKRPSSGTVSWQKNGSPIKKKDIKKRLGYIAPYINLYDELTCEENLDFLLKLRGLSDRSPAIQKALQTAGISSLRDQPFGSLSTGQQQRLRIAASLVHEPDILLLDEPGSNLDKEGHHLIKNLVARFKEAQKMIIVASNISVELELCDRVYSVEKEGFM